VTFLVPLGLLALLSIAVLVLFYLLRVRYRDHEVGSTYLWAQLTRDLAVHEPWQKPRISVLMLIQALLLAGRRSDAEARGQRFHKAYPGSLYGNAVDALLAPREDGGR